MDVSSAALSLQWCVVHIGFFSWILPVTYIHSLHTDWLLGLFVLRKLLMHSIIG